MSTSINHAVLRPVDGLRAEVGAHVANKNLVFGNGIVREFKELESLNSLVVAVVEELGLLVYFPVCWLSDKGILVLFVVCHLVWSDEFFRFFESSLGPRSSVKVVGGSAFTLANQVVNDARELQRGTSLEEEDLMSIRDF